MMGQAASAGKVGFISFLITSNDDTYNIEVSTPTETFEAQCRSWVSAKKIVDKKIKKIEETNINETDEYF